MSFALLCPSSLAARVDMGVTVSHAFIQVWLLALSWVALWMWSSQRPRERAFLPALLANAGSTGLVFVVSADELIANAIYAAPISYADEQAVHVVLVSCVVTTLLVFSLMMRAELSRVIVAVFPRARVLRRRRGK